jgi:hypothetical protein
MNYEKKINLSKQTKIPHHTGGWNFVLKILSEFHSEEGIFVDDLADISFGNSYEYNIYKKIIPYKLNWIGFFHHPIKIAPWYPKNFLMTPPVMISSDEFKESQKNCKGIYTFSKSMASWYREKLPRIKVEQLWHPTKSTDKLFNLDNFLANPRPKVFSIGFFLRRMTSIYFLKCDKYDRVILVNPQVYEYLYKEMTYHKYDLDFNQVKFKSYVSADEYDEILSKNVVFLDLYDSCANNIIIECIARNTPVLVNKQEAIVEYLGEKYPMYYSSIEEASAKLMDKGLLTEAYFYLSELETKKKITSEYFVKSFYNSGIYSSL